VTRPTRTPTTALGAHLDRSQAPTMAADIARAYEATGVVDEILTWDQLTSWFPRALWRPDITPMAAISPDPDSFSDPFLLAALAAAATERLGVR
jgi:phthiodiolone/phenolphthiodiolone dimycocerosates ketoreductase